MERVCIEEKIYFSLYNEFSKIQLLPINLAYQTNSLNYNTLNINEDKTPIVNDIFALFTTPPDNHIFGSGSIVAKGSNGFLVSTNNRTSVIYTFTGVTPGIYELRIFGGNANDIGNGIASISASDTNNINILSPLTTLDKNGNLNAVIVKDYENKLIPIIHQISSLDYGIVLRVDNVFNLSNNVTITITPQNTAGNLVLGGSVILLTHAPPVIEIPFVNDPF
jgi:hypothetical protein